MKNDQGLVLEDHMDGKPVEYVHGSGRILPALENSLEGMEAGGCSTLTLTPESNPGLGENFHFNIIIDQVREASPFEIQCGEPLPAVSEPECGAGCNCH